MVANAVGGSGLFVYRGTILPGAGQKAIALGDINEDGFLDAVIGGDNLRIFLGNGTGSFTLSATLNIAASAVALGDLDGDGDLDLFHGTNSGDYANRVWINQGGVQGGTLGTLVDGGQRLWSQNEFGGTGHQLGSTVNVDLAVAVLNGNDAPTHIALTNVDAAEKISGAIIGLVAITDEDGSPLDHYQLSVDDARFQIDSGWLKLTAQAVLDAVAEPQLTVGILVGDPGQPAQSLWQNVTFAVRANPWPWQNSANPFDTDNSGAVTPLDVLLLINEINHRSANTVGSELPATRPLNSTLPYFDVSGDGYLTPLDVLQVINHINHINQQAAGGEAEGAADMWSVAWPTVSPTPAVTACDLLFSTGRSPMS